MTLIVRTGEGASGEFPGTPERNSLQAAIDFGVVSTNPKWDNDRSKYSVRTVTTDNTEIEWWPCDLEQGNIVFATGGMIPVVHGGWTLSDPGWKVARPVEVPHAFDSLIDQDLASAVYRLTLAASDSSSSHERGHRLLTAIHWWSKAWRNTKSIQKQDRVVYLKTAFEALIGESNSWKGAQALRRIFEQLKGSRTVELWGSDELLWSPDEQRHRTRTREKSGKLDRVTDLEHWFCTFSDARNAVIHEGRISEDLKYQEKDSPYIGPLVFVADRIFREAVAILVSTPENPDLWREPIGRVSASLILGDQK